MACTNNVETPKEEEPLEPEQVEIPTVDETLPESMVTHEDEGMELKKLEHKSLVEEDKDKHQK